MTQVNTHPRPGISGLILVLLSGFALFLAFSYPLHFPPWPSFMNEWLFAVFVGFGLIAFTTTQSTSWPKAGLWIAAGCLIAAHYVFLQHKEPAQQDYLLAALTLLIVGYGAYALGRNLRLTDTIHLPLAATLAAAMLGVVVAAMQWSGAMSPDEWNPGLLLSAQAGDRTPSNIGQANHFGTLLVIAMWVVVYVWVQQPRAGWWRLLAVLSMAVLALGIYLSGSRTAHLNLIVAPVLMAVWCLWRQKSLRLVGLATLPILLVGLVHLTMPTFVEWFGLGQVMAERSIVHDPQRLRLWRMALTAILEEPWLGHGFGGMANAHLRLAPEFGVFDYRIATYAHNSLLDLWVFFGLVLGTVIAAPLLWLWAKIGFKTVDTPQAFLWLMCTGLLVHGMLEYPLHYGYFLGLLCLLLGYLNTPVANSQSTASGKTKPLASALLSLIVLLGLFTIWQGYLATESVYTIARTQGPQAAKESLEKPDRLGSLILPGLWQRIEWSTQSHEDAASWPESKVKDLEAATRWHPFPELIWKVALVHGVRGDFVQAAWWGERLCRMFEPLRCDHAGKDWDKLGQTRDNWPTLPWEQWRSKPAPSAPPTVAPSIP